MNISIHINNGWIWFCVAFGVMLLISLIMKMLSRYFYTDDVVIRKFSLMDLELPASKREIVNLVKGIYRLPLQKSIKTVKALKSEIYLYFIFTPLAYGSIFLLCMKVSWKMSSIGHWIFGAFAWLLVIAWLCNIIGNIYLLKKIRPDVVPSGTRAHSAFMIMEFVKWGIVLTGAVCSLFALFYFWLVGNYTGNSLRYVIIILVEVIVFITARKVFVKKLKEEYDV